MMSNGLYFVCVRKCIYLQIVSIYFNSISALIVDMNWTESWMHSSGFRLLTKFVLRPSVQAEGTTASTYGVCVSRDVSSEMRLMNVWHFKVQRVGLSVCVSSTQASVSEWARTEDEGHQIQVTTSSGSVGRPASQAAVLLTSDIKPNGRANVSYLATKLCLCVKTGHICFNTDVYDISINLIILTRRMLDGRDPKNGFLVLSNFLNVSFI